MLHMYVRSERKTGNCKQEGRDLREEKGGRERGRAALFGSEPARRWKSGLTNTKV